MVESRHVASCFATLRTRLTDPQSYNYAVSGAACSNALTGRPGQGAAPSFGGSYFNLLNPLTTVYSLWIGTNDVGVNSLLTGNQTAGVTIVNVTECAISWMQQMYTYGARRFILQNMIPLNLAPVYAVAPDPLDHYWPIAHNRTDYNIQLQELVMSGNALWDLQVPAALTTLPGASAAVFNSYGLFTDIYNNPSAFLNGTAPLNVTGYYAHSNSTGGDVYFVNDSPDSFMFYDGLHPSEQSSRHVATEIGTSRGMQEILKSDEDRQSRR
ncbi:carbohydrate esterase family 16 protein [Calocera viscosa TUFC12733]|uniref:Carbohydrate esterase family 16 protein n=1 Tax=Calocera viscosa (strain TUFC12733) TaxID=1330018 RepID=A0A167LZV9_CALVF|nr:carbohydrate esterase family 16 protein [Calocera viscosa TUFC12733]